MAPTSTRSTSGSALSAPLKSCPRHPCALVRELRFFLNPIGRSPIHHQIIIPVIMLIMPYQPTKVVEQLFWCLYKLLHQMKVICGMFSSYTIYYASQFMPCTRSYLSFWPQRHRSSSYNIVCKDREMVFVMTLTLAFQAPYLLVHFWSNLPILFQTLHLKAHILQLCMDLLNPYTRILHQCFMQSHNNLQGLLLSCYLLL